MNKLGLKQAFDGYTGVLIIPHPIEPIQISLCTIMCGPIYTPEMSPHRCYVYFVHYCVALYTPTWLPLYVCCPMHTTMTLFLATSCLYCAGCHLFSTHLDWQCGPMLKLWPFISAEVGNSPSSCLTIFVETFWWDPLLPHLHDKEWFLNHKYNLYLCLLCPHLGHSHCKPFWCEHILLWALYLINYALVIQCIG